MVSVVARIKEGVTQNDQELVLQGSNAIHPIIQIGFLI